MSGLRGRVVAVLLLLCVLVGLFVGAGAFEATPSYSGTEDLVHDYESQVGDQTELSVGVVKTDPVRIELEDSGQTRELTVAGLDTTPTEGDQIALFGTVQTEHTIEAHDAIVREPWEMQYMYAVSLVGGFWILARFLNGWQIDRDESAFIPRTYPLVGGDDSDG